MIEGKIDILEAHDWFTMLVVDCEDLPINHITDRRLLHLVHTIEGVENTNETTVTVRTNQVFAEPTTQHVLDADDVYLWASAGTFEFELPSGPWVSPEGALLHLSGRTPWRSLPWDGERIYFKLVTVDQSVP